MCTRSSRQRSYKLYQNSAFLFKALFEIHRSVKKDSPEKALRNEAEKCEAQLCITILGLDLEALFRACF
jgi:hypothetical protein